jgi:hypothetical protein
VYFGYPIRGFGYPIHDFRQKVPTDYMSRAGGDDCLPPGTRLPLAKAPIQVSLAEDEPQADADIAQDVQDVDEDSFIIFCA